MLHDIVLALGGIGGDVLKGVLNEDIFALSISIHPRESAIMKQLIGIADKYKAVKDFIQKVPFFGTENLVLEDGSELTAGLYLRAFRSGVHDSLEPYRHNIVKLEREVLENPHISLSGLLVLVADYLPLLSTLQSLINQIVSRRLHGCQILQVLHVRLSSGVEMVDTAMAKILQRCHQVMLKQLTSLLLYGRLIDPFSEFFIEECGGEGGGTLHTSLTTLDSEGPPDHTEQVEHRIVPGLVPSYIPASVPEKARFIGTTVVLFSQEPPRDQTEAGVNTNVSLYNKTEDTLMEKFRELQSADVLDVSELETVMEDARSCVTQHLFSLAKDQAGLVSQLRLIKDMFLLGRGELFVAFFQKASDCLLNPVRTRSARDLNHKLQEAARDVLLDSDSIMNRFSIKVPTKKECPKANVLSVMELQYKPPWPLHLLFTQSVLTSYNILFKFLLQVKIAEINLHSVWIDQIKEKDNKMVKEVWMLRNSLMFLIHSLQCYLHLDVMESQFNTLLAELDKTQDFEEVIHKHTVFITHITSQAFLLTTQVKDGDQPTTTKRHPVNSCLTDIFKICDDFCEEVKKSKIDETNMSQLSERMSDKVGVLLELITLLGGKVSGLRLLLLRVDYNRYFSNHSVNRNVFC